MRTSALLLAAACALFVGACSSDTAPTPDPTVGASGSSGSPSAPASPFSIPEPRDDSLARSDVGGKSDSFDGAVEGTPYVVHAVCEGVESMTYKLFVNDEERSSRTFSCGKDVRHTAFIAKGGEKVRVELEPQDGAKGFVEVVPHR